MNFGHGVFQFFATFISLLLPGVCAALLLLMLLAADVSFGMFGMVLLCLAVYALLFIALTWLMGRLEKRIFKS